MISVRSESSHLLQAGAAAFATYFCMYAFRKPFTAGLYADQEWMGLQFKAAIVLSQLFGYTLSKFIGVRVVSEISPTRRATAILALIGISQLALVVFAFAPPTLQVIALFVNGIPLGMIFGLVLSYLEGRRATEALSAALCASFIVSSGTVKSIGRWLIEDYGMVESMMPMVVGFIFVVPTVLAVILLDRTPRPTAADIAARAPRTPMTREQRSAFWRCYWPGLSMFILVYVLLTMLRALRDDFGVEIWRDLGVTERPGIFARTELWVALVTTALAGLGICVRDHLAAIKVTCAIVGFSLVGLIVVAVGESAGWISALTFMIGSGVALYVPYIAFHTTLFERVVASSRMPSNLGFVMYLADSLGYLGYALLIAWKTSLQQSPVVLPMFKGLLILSGGVCIIAVMVAGWYFHRRLGRVLAPEHAIEASDRCSMTH